MGAARRLPALSLLVAVSAGLAGCAGLEPLPLRPQPVPYADTVPVPEPSERVPDERLVLFREAVAREAVLPFIPNVARSRGEALNLTHFDEVVPSAWFEHRIGTGRMTPEEVRRGATTAGPDTSGPWVVVAAKREGITPGFTIEDARGDRYLLKPDGRGHPYLGSAAGAIGNRIFHGAGYHVPEDYVVTFHPSRVVEAPGASSGDRDGPPSSSEIRTVLDLSQSLPDGRYRALASKIVPGIPKGPFLFEGVRDDDPNDYFHHEYRRELRGLFVIAAWANHTDMRFANTLDSYLPSGHVRHYLIDFASTLGSSAGLRSHTARHGREYQFDLWPVMGRFVTLGLYHRGWEGQNGVVHPAIGWLPVEDFEPGNWRPGWPNRAFLSMTPADGYWGAKIVAGFSDAHIRAAVEAGELPEAAADTLVAILAERRDRIVAHWFARVTPLEEPELAVAPAAAAASGSAGEAGGGSGSAVTLVLRFRDLGLERDVWRPGTAYEWTFEDEYADLYLEGGIRARRTRRQEIRIPLPEGPRATASEDGTLSREALATVRVRVNRPDARPATIYLLRTPGGGYRVAGLEH